MDPTFCPHRSQCRSSSPTLVTSSSPMLSPPPSTAGTLWTAFQHWEANASLHESITRMREFIGTCFAISDASFAVEKLMSSMYVVGTRTLTLLEEHQNWVTTTRSRMVTLFAEDWEDQSWLAEVAMVQLAISGRRSRVRRIEMSFGNWCIDWILRLLAVHSSASRNTQTGNFEQWSQYTSILSDSRSLEEILTEDLNGLDNLASGLLDHF